METDTGKYKIILEKGGSTEKKLKALRDVMGVTNAEAFHWLKVSPAIIFSTDDQALAEKKAARLKEIGAPVRLSKPAARRRVSQTIGPNDLCPCGSGKKYKFCHGKPAASAVKPAASAVKPAASAAQPETAASDGRFSKLVHDSSAEIRKTGVSQPAKPAPAKTAPVPAKTVPTPAKPAPAETASSAAPRKMASSAGQRFSLPGKTSPLFTADRAKAWIWLAAVTAVMPLAMYLFYLLYGLLMHVLSHAFPGLFKAVSFLTNEVMELSVCSVLATLVYMTFSEELTVRSEKIRRSRVGLRYLVLGLLMLAVTLSAAVYLAKHQSDQWNVSRILCTLYAMLLSVWNLFCRFDMLGNPRLLFWKKKETVFAVMEKDGFSYLARIEGGPGLIRLNGLMDSDELLRMLQWVQRVRPEVLSVPELYVLCCTERKERYLCCDYILVKSDLRGLGYSQENLRYLPEGKSGILLEYSANKAPKLNYPWK